MKIKIGSILQFILLYSIFVRLFTDIFEFPSVLTYLPDLLIVCVMIFFLTKSKEYKLSLYQSYFIKIVAVYGIVCVLSFMFNIAGDGIITCFIWGIRNIFRFLIYGILCLYYVSYQRALKVQNILYNIMHINVVVSTYQYFVMGLRNDFVGGLFGTYRGCNGVTNIFICIIAIELVVGYLYQETSSKQLIIGIVECLFVAVLSEIKLFFVELVIIVFLAIVISKKTRRKTTIIFASTVGLFFAYQLLAIYYPYFANFFTIENISNYLKTGALNTQIANEYLVGMSRTNAIPKINAYFFEGKIIKYLLGFGLGNTDTSTIRFFGSTFYTKYSYLNYQNFYYSMVYIETGILGLVSFGSQYIYLFIVGLKNRKNNNTSVQIQSVSLTILSVIAIISFVYDSSLRTSTSGYLFYYVVACMLIIISKPCKSYMSEN